MDTNLLKSTRIRPAFRLEFYILLILFAATTFFMFEWVFSFIRLAKLNRLKKIH